MLKLVIVVSLFAVALATGREIPSTGAPIAPARTSAATAQEFEIDPLHSTVLFRVQHLRAAPFYGRFNAIQGRFRVAEDDPAASFVDVTIPVDSIDTANTKRDDHLKSGDFFSAKEFPTITLKSQRITAAGDGRWTMTADLTLRGVTKEVQVDVRHTGTAEISERFGLRSGYEATFTIDRTAFGMDFYAEQGVLGAEVQVTVAIEGKLPA